MVSLERIVGEEEPAVICLVETHLDEDEQIELPGYELHRRDRNKDGGGCLIAYKLSMKTLVTKLPRQETESVWIRVGNDVGGVKIGVAYFPQEYSSQIEIQRVYDNLEEIVRDEKDNESVLICGDFNAKIFCEEGEEVSKSGKMMKKFNKQNNMVVINEGVKCKGKWTRSEGESKSIIDYVLTKETDTIVEKMHIDEEREFSVYHRIEEEIVYSDHYAIKIKLDWMAMIREINSNRKIKVMTEKGWQKYERELAEAKLSEKINTSNDIDEEYEKWSKGVQKIYENNLKKVTKKNEWKINRLLMKQIKHLKRRSRGEHEGKKKICHQRIQLIREHCDNEIKMRNAMKVEKLVQSIARNGKTDMTKFYRFNKKQKKTVTTIKTVTTEDGRKIDDRNVAVKEFEKHYTELLKKREAETPEEKENEEIVQGLIDSLVTCTNNNKHRITTIEEVEEVIKELKKKKAVDECGWRNEHMIHGGREMCSALSKIFTMVDAQKKPPKQWEKMKIKSLFKDTTNRINNTRGLFLTSVVSKAKEKTIKNRNDIQSSPFQCGGKKGVAVADHTLVLLEMINRNRYLGSDTYLVFIDMTKCFDKLWLEDGVLELWRAGLDATDARIILEMNRKARAVIETPVGKTEEIVLDNVCKQGTVFAVQIGCKTMERVNGIRTRAVTCFGPHLNIESLTYVDDIAGGGNKETVETTITNCSALEEKKKASVNLEKSKWMRVGTKNKIEEMKAEVKCGRLDEVSKYKYLGTWINNKATCSINIEKRKNNGEGAMKEISQMTHVSKVGNQEVPLKLALMKTVYLKTLLFGLEAWANLTEAEMKDLESAQANAIRRLLCVPKCTSYFGILNETGIWTVKYQLMYTRLMLYHNIINSNEKKRFAKKLLMEEERSPFDGCWVLKIRDDATKLGINIESMKKELKSGAKRMIKKEIGKKMQEEITGNVSKKMRTIAATSFEMKEYLKGVFSSEEVSDILKSKLHMLWFKANYRDNEEMYQCRLCGREEETSEHVFTKCVILEDVRKEYEIDEKILEAVDESGCRKIVRIKRMCDSLIPEGKNKERY